MRWAAAALVLLTATAVRADDQVELSAAIAGDKPGAGQSVLVGSSGQLYYRDAKSATWKRTRVGGLAATVTGALRVDGNVIAVGARTPIYRWKSGAWSAQPLGNRGSTTVAGAGGAAAFSVGRHIYVRRGSRWVRTTSAPRTISALWMGGGGRIYAADDNGALRRRSGGSWRTIAGKLAADEIVVELIGTPGKSLYARTSAGNLLRVTASSATPLPRGPKVTDLRPTAMAPSGDGGLWVVGEVGADAGRRWILARTDGGTLKTVRELAGLAPGDRYRVMRSADDGSLLIASTRGAVRLRGPSGSWSEGTVSGELPPSATRTFPEAAPARAR